MQWASGNKSQNVDYVHYNQCDQMRWSFTYEATIARTYSDVLKLSPDVGKMLLDRMFIVFLGLGVRCQCYKLSV